MGKTDKKVYGKNIIFGVNMKSKSGSNNLSVKDFIRKNKAIYRIATLPRNILRRMNILQSIILLTNRLIILTSRIMGTQYYQPVFGNPKIKSRRLSTDRWNVMKEYMPKGAFSFIDVGCGIGYFVFMASEMGAFGIGFERNKEFIDFANAVKSANKMNLTAFINMEINKETISLLPKVDVLCCFSIFQHWVKAWGFDVANVIFTAITDKTDSIFFETGQPNENYSWASEMSFMSPDIRKWIENYLKSKGFVNITLIGEFHTQKGDVPRLLFFASRKSR